MSFLIIILLAVLTTLRSGALICYHRRPISLLVPPKQKTLLRPWQRTSYGARLTMHCQWGWLSIFCFFCPWWPSPLTFDLDIQTSASEGPNTSSLWIWRKSVQRFPRYLSDKQKNKQNEQVTDSAKTEP